MPDITLQWTHQSGLLILPCLLYMYNGIRWSSIFSNETTSCTTYWGHVWTYFHSLPCVYSVHTLVIAYLSIWKGAAASDTSPSDEKIQSLKLQDEEHYRHTVSINLKYHSAAELCFINSHLIRCDPASMKVTYFLPDTMCSLQHLKALFRNVCVSINIIMMCNH